MNGKLVFAMAVLCAVMLADTDALRLRIRGRRIWRRIKKPVCRAACTYTCTAVTSGSAAPVCGLGCREVCNRKKRTANLLDEVKENQVIIPLTRDFEVYDINNNGTIEITELAEVLSVEPFRSDVIKAFSLADVDDDGHISEVELEEAPWFFEEDEEANSKDLEDDDDDTKDLS